MNTELTARECLPELLDLALALGTAPSSAEMERSLKTLGAMLGFESSAAVLGSRAEEGQLVDFTLSVIAPTDWRREYFRCSRYEADPVLTALLHAPGDGQPMTWDQLFATGLDLAPHQAAARQMGEMIDQLKTHPNLGSGAGLAFGRCEGAKCLLWSVAGPRFEADRATLAGLSLVAPYLFEAMEAKQRRRFKNLLTERQMEILNLSQRGLSIRQVAEMTGYSERSVHNHLSTIYERLDVFNKTHAVARARSMGLIPPL